MYPLAHLEPLFKKIESLAPTLVWWSPSQRARGDDLRNDPTQGERAWIIPPTTGLFLYEKIQENAPHTVLELGTSIGYSTLWIASALEPDAHLITIDKNPEKHRLAQTFLTEAGLADRVTFLTGTIREELTRYLPSLHQKIDVMFFDADRGHYHEYFTHLEPFLAPHVVCIADNAINMRARMTPFVQLLEQKNFEIQILDQDNGILIAHRKNS